MVRYDSNRGQAARLVSMKKLTSTEEKWKLKIQVRLTRIVRYSLLWGRSAENKIRFLQKQSKLHRKNLILLVFADFQVRRKVSFTHHDNTYMIC